MNTPLFHTDTTTVSRPRRVSLLGQEVDLITAAEFMEFVCGAAEASAKAIAANHNLHSLHLAQRSKGMAEIYRQAEVIQVDSRPLLSWARLLGLPATAEHRCTYLDWRDDFWRMASERRWQVFYLGGAPGVAARAAERLMQRWPGVEIAVRDGFFDRTPGSEGNAATVRMIEEFRPHVLFVGMGMPIQEEWIAENLAELQAGVILPVGAAFDYEAGEQIAAPRILGRLGVEWLFRLATQPRRLFRRYLVEPWSLVGPAGADLGGLLLRGRSAEAARGAPADASAPVQS